MNESRTSDLTCSVTSSNLNDLRTSQLDSSAYYTNDDTDEDDFRETDTLLRKSTLPNMTHIDDISFVDEEAVALNVWNVIDTDEDNFRETNTLVRKSTLPNLTHIDNISFVDEETVALNIWIVKM